jgi:cell division protein FtsZ
MAIMTGVKSAQVLGPGSQQQADRSRRAMDDAARANGGDPADADGEHETGRREQLDVIR